MLALPSIGNVLKMLQIVFRQGIIHGWSAISNYDTRQWWTSIPHRIIKLLRKKYHILVYEDRDETMIEHERYLFDKNSQQLNCN